MPPRAAEEQKDFRGQVYESARARVERERAQQRKLSEERGEGKSGRAAALTFGAAKPEQAANNPPLPVPRADNGLK